jgi:hypothetical protein
MERALGKPVNRALIQMLHEAKSVIIRAIRVY